MADLFLPGSLVTAAALSTDPRLHQLQAVLASTARICAALWAPPPPDAAAKAYKGVSGYRERVGSKRRPWTEKDIFVFRELYAWRDREAQARGTTTVEVSIYFTLTFVHILCYVMVYIYKCRRISYVHLSCGSFAGRC